MTNSLTLLLLLGTNVLFHQSWPLPPCPEPQVRVLPHWPTNFMIPRDFILPAWPGTIITNLSPPLFLTNSSILYTQNVLHVGPGVRVTPRTNDGKVEWIIGIDGATEEERKKREADAEELDRYRRLFLKSNAPVTP